MILASSHLAGPECLPQICGHCGMPMLIEGTPFPEGTRVVVIISTVLDRFTAYVAGVNDSNEQCWETGNGGA